MNWLERANKRSKSSIELAISESSSLTEEQKASLRNWLDGIVDYVNKTTKQKTIKQDGGKYSIY